MPEDQVPPLVTPFVGERYAATAGLSDRVAPPYDVIDPDERAALAARDRYNIVHLSLPSGDGDRYTNAATLLAEWRAAGVLVPEKTPSVYVLQQEFTTPEGATHVRMGIIGAVAVEPYSTGRIKPHEETWSGPKEDRLALLRATRAMFESLFMLARDEEGELGRLLDRATAKGRLASAELRGVKSTLWRVPGRRAEVLARAASRGSLYIADGHHRYETSMAYREEYPAAERVPVLIVPLADPGLAVLPTHRLVYGSEVDGDAVVSELRDRFQLRELPATANYLEELSGLRSRGTACVVVLPGARAVAFLLRAGASLGDLPFAHQPSVSSLDVARVDEIVVKHLLSGAGDIARVEYSADANHVIDEVRLGNAVAGVLLNPTAVEEVLTVADAGAVMPPKSTYFVPKVPSGLVIMGY